MLNASPATAIELSAAGLSRSTVIVKLFVADRLGVPLSATTTVITFVEPVWLTSGRQEKTPFVGFNVEPTGPLSRLNVRGCAGMSGSVAMLVMVMVMPAPT